MPGIERIIDISEGPVRLQVANGLLVIHRDETPETTVPLAEIAVVVMSQPRVTLTHGVLSGLAEAGAGLVVCNDKFMPVGMLLPLEGHFTQAERFARQARIPLPIRKQLWKQIVEAKILAQARLLADLRGGDLGLPILARRVRSGDTGNHEGQAARLYWPALFRDPTFRRDRNALDQNRLLNYGYAVLRAIVARAVCAAGLHPSLGIHHHNRYDAFCLADDLMEPFRPIVDRQVAILTDTHGKDCPLDRNSKGTLIDWLLGRFLVEGESRTLFDIAARTASSLAAVYERRRKGLILPEL